MNRLRGLLGSSGNPRKNRKIPITSRVNCFQWPTRWFNFFGLLTSIRSSLSRRWQVSLCSYHPRTKIAAAVTGIPSVCEELRVAWWWMTCGELNQLKRLEQLWIRLMNVSPFSSLQTIKLWSDYLLVKNHHELSARPVHRGGGWYQIHNIETLSEPEADWIRRTRNCLVSTVRQLLAWLARCSMFAVHTNLHSHHVNHPALSPPLPPSCLLASLSLFYGHPSLSTIIHFSFPTPPQLF